MVNSKILVTVAFVITLIWSAALSRPDGRVHIWAIGAKSNLSLVVRSRSGELAVVNPQKSANFLSSLGGKIPFHKRDLSLVVLINDSRSSQEALSEIEKRYQVAEVWAPVSDVYVSKNTKIYQISGWQNLGWQDIIWQNWSVLGYDLLTTLEFGNHRLMFANKGNADFWASVPDQRGVEVLVGPLVSGSGWSGKSLQELVNPNLQIVNQEVDSAVPLKIAGEVEIVW